MERDEDDNESEIEEDRTFLDDVEEQGPLFYWGLDRELEEESDKEEYVNNKPLRNTQEPKKTKDDPLKKLWDRLEDHLAELPVVSFNSGKYDWML